MKTLLKRLALALLLLFALNGCTVVAYGLIRHIMKKDGVHTEEVIADATETKNMEAFHQCLLDEAKSIEFCKGQQDTTNGSAVAPGTKMEKRSRKITSS